jgi:O-methyltransferase
LNLLFLIVSLALVALVLVLLSRYAWGIFFDKNYFPVEWENAVKEGRVSKELMALERNYPDKVRFFNWWFQVERLKRDGIPGDFAELGVYKGESARILHRMDPTRKFHLFDTFEGFKEEDLRGETGEAATYTTRHFADTSLELARRTIGGNENVIFHPGRFPESAVSSRQSAVINQDSGLPTHDSRPRTPDCAYALVNLDADLYAPTIAGLEYFYPRLSPGGVIIVHDYNFKWPGIKKAVDEYAKKISGTIILVPDMDGSVMLVKSLVGSSGRSNGLGLDVSLDG